VIDPYYLLGVIVAMGAVSFALRALPFVAAQWLNKHPLVHRLGEFLPLAIMTLLLVHSAVGNAADDPAAPWPELLAVALVVLLQWWRRNALLSIVLGVCAYVTMRNIGG
jgi:branched-subunit amino acid transport protein AzlD